MCEHSGEDILLNYLKEMIRSPRKASLDISPLPENLRELGEEMRILGRYIKEAASFAGSLAEGDISAPPPAMENVLADPLKTLQSNLRHLVWATQQVAAGNYSQEVDFMGDFSAAFQSLVSQLKVKKQFLEREAYTDALTGAWNRLYSNKVLTELWNEGKGFAIGLVDVDNLQACNDKFGHVEGDRYLQSVYRILQEHFRGGEYIFRMGGDEFLVLSQDTSCGRMAGTLEAAREHYLGEYEEKLEYHRSFSYGCSQADPERNTSYQRCLSEAEQRVYHYQYMHMERADGIVFPEEQEGAVDKQALGGRAFEAFSISSDERYLFLCNLQTNVSRWSKAAVEEFNLPGEYMFDAGNIWLQCIHPDDREMYSKDLEAVFARKKQYHNVSYRAKNRAGQYVLCTCKGYLLKGNEQNPDIFAGTIFNHGVIDNVDSVTNLYNVYKLMDALRKCRQEENPLNLLLVDVHQFRRVNSSYGYICGNNILKTFGQKLQEMLGERGMVFRYTGAKFAMITEAGDLNSTQEWYQAMNEIAGNELYLDGTRVGLTISVGALSFQRLDVEERVALAELEYALNISKKEDQGQLVYLDDSRHGKARRHLEMIDSIIHSVLFGDFRGFYLVYQPQVRPDGTISGAEALIRWRNDVWGEIPPADFIPILENDRCFYGLGLWILRSALQGAKQIIRDHPGFTISVNVSYRQLEHVDFRSDVISIVNKMSFPPGNLILELTEHCQSLQKEILEENLSFLRAQGIRIAADDFGTGYSSLAILRDLPLDCIKIDKLFIEDIVKSVPDRIILKHTIQCARDFGILVCVEGVEDMETMNVLKEFEPYVYQGFLFSRPISLEELEKMLK